MVLSLCNLQVAETLPAPSQISFGVHFTGSIQRYPLLR